MSSPDLLQHLHGWIKGNSPPPLTLHCFRLFKAVPLPDGGTISAVSVRHQRSGSPRAPELVVAELWNLCDGPVQAADVKEMGVALATFRAWYAEILEEAETEGLRRRHRFSVHGNLIGPSVQSSALVDLLSHHGGEVAFWTVRRTPDGTEFEPYYGEDQRPSPSVLARMLDHLAWDAPQDPGLWGQVGG